MAKRFHSFINLSWATVGEWNSILLGFTIEPLFAIHKVCLDEINSIVAATRRKYFSFFREANFVSKHKAHLSNELNRWFYLLCDSRFDEAKHIDFGSDRVNGVLHKISNLIVNQSFQFHPNDELSTLIASMSSSSAFFMRYPLQPNKLSRTEDDFKGVSSVLFITHPRKSRTFRWNEIIKWVNGFWLWCKWIKIMLDPPKVFKWNKFKI